MLTLLATLVVLGLVFYLVNLIPMAEPFPQIIRVVAILIAVVLILQALGINLGLPSIR
jgi:hypothetical protein